MALVFILILTAVVIGFIVYKAVQMNKKTKSTTSGGGGNVDYDTKPEKPKK